jgi:hypothetical protein
MLLCTTGVNPFRSLAAVKQGFIEDMHQIGILIVEA